jgi:NAD(P)-dependent dehydrogenase (short-subunit alcohol dehydrogenase family)
MSRVLITGSTDGLGRMAAELLIEQGHKVVLHGRNEQRAGEALRAMPGAETAVIGDLAGITQTIDVADQANRLGAFDAVIHNAGIGYREPRRNATEDGLPQVFAVNTLAPYILTARIKMPKRLVYLSSGMHHRSNTGLDDLDWTKRRWQGAEAYAESKFHDVLLAFAVARLFPDVLSNALEPGWVATKMGGPGAPDDLSAAPTTQVWLATSNDAAARVSGQYFYHRKLLAPNPAARDAKKQDQLLEACQKFSGIALG